MRPAFPPQVLSESWIAHDTPVVPAYATTPYATSLPFFGDDLWDMRVLRVRRNQHLSSLVMDFRSFTDSTRRLVAKEYLYARLNVKHPQYCPLAITGLKVEYYLLRRFFTYLDTVWMEYDWQMLRRLCSMHIYLHAAWVRKGKSLPQALCKSVS